MELIKGKSYTYADYITWQDDVRREIIDGIVYDMGSPTRLHQRISALLHYKLMMFLDGKKCEAYAAPFDLRLAADLSDDVVVQPDILVVCDLSKLEDGKTCRGAPDMIIEILSDSSAKYDRLIKYKLYLRHGVKECWIIDPSEKIVQVNLLLDKQYVSNVYGETDSVSVSVLEGCKINLREIFEIF